MRIKAVLVDAKTSTIKAAQSVGGCTDVFLDFHQNTFTLSRVLEDGSTKCMVIPYTELNYLEYTK